MRSLTQHSKPWSKADVALLKKRYANKLLHCGIAAQLKRTLNVFESKAIELGLAGKN